MKEITAINYHAHKNDIVFKPYLHTKKAKIQNKERVIGQFSIGKSKLFFKHCHKLWHQFVAMLKQA